MSLMPHQRRHKPVPAPVLFARNEVAAVQQRRGGEQIALGAAGLLDLDVATAISLRDALTVLIQHRFDTAGGVPCPRP